MFTRLSWLSFWIIFYIVIFSPRVLAHGSKVSYRQTEAIQIRAQYDNGSPMGNAQVIVYAPNNPATPWLKGMTDTEGKFVFIPDASIRGSWNVTVRVGGHGSIINIPLEQSSEEVETRKTPTGENVSEKIINQSNTSNQTNSSNYTSLQKLVMVATGVWGFVGTALFFSRKSNKV
jgi:nickel transport protein